VTVAFNTSEMALIRRWYKEKRVVDMDIEELDEYARRKNILSERGKSSPERLSSSPEEFQKSSSPFSLERDTPSPLPGDTPSPLPTELRGQDSPPNTESSSSPDLYELPRDQKKNVQQGVKQNKDQRKLTKDEKEAREEGIDKFISNYQIINMDNNELKEELKRLMSERGMTLQQHDFCLKIRKKGKNKVAAQEHRAKKMKELAFLNTCVQLKEKEHQKNIETKKRLISEKSEWEYKLEWLSALVCKSQNKDPTIWRVVLDENSDDVELVLRESRSTCL